MEEAWEVLGEFRKGSREEVALRMRSEGGSGCSISGERRLVQRCGGGDVIELFRETEQSGSSRTW